MVINECGEVNVKQTTAEGFSIDVFAEIEVIDYMDEAVTMWLTKEDVSKLIDELSQLLKGQ